MLGKLTGLLAALLIALTLGCGSGGPGSPGHSTRALTKVKTAGLLADGETIGAIMLTISLPPGVTVPLDPVTKEPASGVVSLVGASDPAMVFQYVRYTAPTATLSGSLAFMVLNAQGFGPVDYIGVQLDITAGYFPVASDFAISNFAVAGITNYTEISIGNPTVSVDIN